MRPTPCGQIGETVDFDEAVQKALEFAKKDGNTLVIATADHGHSSQIVENVTEDDLRGARRGHQAADRAGARHHVPGPDASS